LADGKPMFYDRTILDKTRNGLMDMIVINENKCIIQLRDKYANHM